MSKTTISSSSNQDTNNNTPDDKLIWTKTKSSDVDLFLKVLKNKPKWSPTSGKESPNVQVLKKAPDEKSLSRTSLQKQKEEHISFRRMSCPTSMSMVNHSSLGGNWTKGRQN
jgi:hypothetical protein